MKNRWPFGPVFFAYSTNMTGVAAVSSLFNICRRSLFMPLTNNRHNSGSLLTLIRGTRG